MPGTKGSQEPPGLYPDPTGKLVFLRLSIPVLVYLLALLMILPFRIGVDVGAYPTVSPRALARVVESHSSGCAVVS